MKSIKLLGLAVVAAMSLMAFVGMPSASITPLLTGGFSIYPVVLVALAVDATRLCIRCGFTSPDPRGSFLTVTGKGLLTTGRSINRNPNAKEPNQRARESHIPTSRFATAC
jgi:hypothetical protein